MALHLRMAAAIRNLFPPVNVAILALAVGVASSRGAEEEAGRDYRAAMRAIEAKIAELRTAGDEEGAAALEAQLFDALQRVAENLERRTAEVESQRRSAADAKKSELQRRVETAREYLEELRAAGGGEVARELSVKLDSLEEACATSDYAFPLSDEPEAHAVALGRGAQLPAAVADRFPNRSLGYAEVRLEYQARPVVLALSASAPTVWKVVVGEGARLHAVVLPAENHHLVEDPGVPVFVDAAAAGGGDAIEQFSGRRLAGRAAVDVYHGDPIIIGSANRDWISSCLEPAVEAVLQAARAERQRLALAELGDWRFEAIYDAGEPDSSRGPGFHAASRGIFTIAGPITSTLRTIPDASWRCMVDAVGDGDTSTTFALSDHGDLVFVEAGGFVEEEPPKVALSSDLRLNTRFTALAYDSQRNRLLVADDRGGKSQLLFYGVEDRRWSQPIASRQKCYALAYAADEDVFYGIMGDERIPHLAKTMLARIEADGELQELASLDVPPPSLWNHGHPQLVYAGGRLVYLSPPTSFDLMTGRQTTLIDRLHVIDPGDGRILYSGPITPHEVGEVVVERSAPAADGVGVLARLDAKLEQVEREIARRAADDSEDPRLEPWRRRLASQRQRLVGKPAKRDEARLHVVGFYDSHDSVVRVTDASGPVILVLCTYESASWTIEAAEGVQLERILVGGYHAQTVRSSPPGVPISIGSYDQGGEGFHTYGLNDDDWPEAIRRIEELTKLKIATFVGGYRDQQHVSIVGPDNFSWRSQDVLFDLNQLLAEVDTNRASPTLEALRRHQFYAIHFGQMPRQAAPQNPRMGGQSSYFGPFTVEGPIIRGATPLATPAENVVYDPESRLLITRRGGGLSVSDLRTGQETNIAFDQALPRLSWPSGLAYDAERRRLLLNSFGGGGYLYQYDLNTAQWSVLRKPGLGSKAIVYAPDQDALFAIDGHMARGGLNEIRQFNAHGAFVRSIRLSRPIDLGGGRSDEQVQMVYFAEHAAFLTYGSNRPRRGGAGADEPGRIVVVNVSTGDVVYEGELTPQVERREFSDRELELVWDDLASAGPAERDSLIWSLASGREVAIAFLAERLDEFPSPPDRDLAALVERLDANAFAEREKAYAELQELGSQSAGQLSRFAAEHLSPEVRSRLRTLLAAWEAGEPQNDVERQLTGAAAALARIGSAEAKQLLHALAQSGPLVLQARARRELSDLERDIDAGD